MREPEPVTIRGPEQQLALYTQGSDLPLSAEEWEQRARDVLSDGPFGYVAGGAGAEDTMRANREAFYRWRIAPRMLCDVSHRTLATSLLGLPLSAPLLLAPVGVQSVIHPDADRASARAAASLGVPFILSTLSSVSMEEVASVMGEAPRWFQLYAVNNPEIVRSMVQRAERAGYSAIVVTLDTNILAWRERDLRNRYLPFLTGEGLANFVSDPVFRALLVRPPEEDLQAAAQQWLRIFSNPRLSWNDLDAIRSMTSLPVLLKGILHPDDARKALEYGANGIVVSNHGGRQVDGAVASLDALPPIRESVGSNVPILLDSGIRHGADIFKAMALGADAALLGRPFAYALAVAGERGVSHLLRNMIAELDLQMALSGCCSVADIGRSTLLRQ